jgi:hypothetical protein
MSDEDDVRDKDYGVDANEYYYNGDSPQYLSWREACAAQMALHGRTLLGRVLKVQPAKHSKEGACNRR